MVFVQQCTGPHAWYVNNFIYFFDVSSASMGKMSYVFMNTTLCVENAFYGSIQLLQLQKVLVGPNWIANLCKYVSG